MSAETASLASPALRSTGIGPVFVTWAVAALLALVPVAVALDAAFPILTVVWILVPLLLVARTRDVAGIGFRRVPPRLFFETAAVNLAFSFALMLTFEPWSHTYEHLLQLATSTQPIDSTFAWLVRLPRLAGLLAMTLYSGLVTMFGEELFFRGWLLQTLRRRMGTWRAIGIQASLFTIPNALVAAFMSPLQGSLYVVVYAWLSVGVIGGWAAARTGSIWPSLASVTLVNLVLVGLLT